MTTTNSNLEGQWILKSGVGPQLLPDTKITAEFKNGKLRGSGSCNQYSASYTVEPLYGNSGKIQIQGIGFTEKFCGEEINTQESNYFQALEQVKEYSLTDEGLILPYPSPSRYLLFTRMTKTKVFEVQDIGISAEPPSLTASGTVNTAGWKDAELIKRPSSSGGKLEFDFIAQPPDGIVAQVITPIEAIYSLSQEEQGKNHFIVYASQNQKEIFLE
jgi:heat shock protein HslJ